MLVRCTAKMLIAARVAKADVVEATPSDQDWYANLFWVMGRKCVLLTHAGSLFSIFVPDVRVSALRPLGAFVVSIIRAEVRSEGLPLDALGPLDPDDVAIAKTASRSILGCMNDLALHCEWATEDAGGLDRLDVPGLNHQLRRTLLGPLGSTYPIEAAGSRKAGAEIVDIVSARHQPPRR